MSFHTKASRLRQAKPCRQTAEGLCQGLPHPIRSQFAAPAAPASKRHTRWRLVALDLKPPWRSPPGQALSEEQPAAATAASLRGLGSGPLGTRFVVVHPTADVPASERAWAASAWGGTH